ncbi:DUF3857 domain-containing protein [Flavobacteriaceae bacterium F08102]|nr:DUF3857 domain-containing protein [Flavobacteriaceae bacterium F08102]
MKVPFFLFLVLIFHSPQSKAQETDLSVTAITPKLLKNANSIVRFKDTKIAIKHQKNMLIETRSAITVLNKFADKASELVINYDKNTRIKNLKVIVYDARGNKLLTVNKSKFNDYSAADGMSLFNDGRLKYYRYVPTSYPYTFYYEVEIESENTAFIPHWQPINAYNQSVQQNNFSIQYPSDLTLQTLENQFDAFDVVKNNTETEISYQLKNNSAVRHEEMNLGLHKTTPTVRFGLNKFHLEGYDGSANSWKDFGQWMNNNLIRSRSDLPEATVQKIQQLVNGVEDPIERAKIVYEYVQKKTRYISVQVGIGGWMPMLASEVDRLGYGDCKALTNYTKALMDAADVESYYTAVYANNKRDIEKELISVQGNHVILNIPQPDKDIWLECTSQSVPFGYLGSFTDDRRVLVLKPEGGELKNTKTYADHENKQVTSATINIDQHGGLNGVVNILSKGIQYEDHYFLEKATERDIASYYKDRYWPYINNLTLENYEFNNDRDSILFKENLTIKAPNYASFSGARMLFNLNTFNRVSNIPKRYTNRKQAFEITHGYYDIDTYTIRYPATFEIEGIPSNVSIENQFGSYRMNIEKLPNHQLKFTRELILRAGQFNAEVYDTYRNFRRTIVKHDKAKIALLKSTP